MKYPYKYLSFICCKSTPHHAAGLIQQLQQKPAWSRNLWKRKRKCSFSIDLVNELNRINAEIYISPYHLMLFFHRKSALNVQLESLMVAELGNTGLVPLILHWK